MKRYNSLLCPLQARVSIARSIEKMEYQHNKAQQHNSWFQQAAEALEVDLDDNDLMGEQHPNICLDTYGCSYLLINPVLRCTTLPMSLPSSFPDSTCYQVSSEISNNYVIKQPNPIDFSVRRGKVGFLLIYNILHTV